MAELKPCPFCGGKAEILYTGKYECFIQCRRKCCEQTRLYKTKGSAIKAWNKRANDGLASNMVEVVRCQDCKFARWLSNSVGEISRYCLNNGYRVDNDHFCSEGERE